MLHACCTLRPAPTPPARVVQWAYLVERDALQRGQAAGQHRQAHVAEAAHRVQNLRTTPTHMHMCIRMRQLASINQA